MTLKSVLIASAAAGLALLASGCTARTPSDRPWCGTISEIGSPDCSYETLEQCIATVAAVGGICTLNPRGPDGGRKRVR